MKKQRATQVAQLQPSLFDEPVAKTPARKISPTMFLNLRQGATAWVIAKPSPEEQLRRNFGEFPRDATESSLSRILLPNVSEKYFLSSRACQGILNRARARGKELPHVLKEALERQATGYTDKQEATGK